MPPATPLNATNVRKRVADLGEVLWDIEDRLLDGAVPDELLAALVAELGPCRSRLKKLLAALTAAKRSAKQAAPVGKGNGRAPNNRRKAPAPTR
jgi:hypothetical protein